MKYAFFPGCSLESTGWDFERSTRAVCQALGIELVDIPDWVCCGSTPAHTTNASLSVALPVMNLQKAKSMGLPVLTACASCYSRLRTANNTVLNDPEERSRAERVTGKPYDGRVEVRHLLDVLREGPASPERCEGRLLLRLSVDTAAQHCRLRRCRASHLYGPALDGHRRGGGGMAVQDRMLRRIALHHPFRNRQPSQPSTPVNGPSGRGRLPGGRLSPVRKQSRSAAGGRNKGPWSNSGNAGALYYPTRGARLGLVEQGCGA
jgi:hypothetical protein